MELPKVVFGARQGGKTELQRRLLALHMRQMKPGERLYIAHADSTRDVTITRGPEQITDQSEAAESRS